VKLVIAYLFKKKTAKHEKILGKPFHYMRSVIERGARNTEKTGKLFIFKIKKKSTAGETMKYCYV
jgi:hypothetical protein